jgi:hypothetical protein
MIKDFRRIKTVLLVSSSMFSEPLRPLEAQEDLGLGSTVGEDGFYSLANLVTLEDML